LFSFGYMVNQLILTHYRDDDNTIWGQVIKSNHKIRRNKKVTD